MVSKTIYESDKMIVLLGLGDKIVVKLKQFDTSVSVIPGTESIIIAPNYGIQTTELYDGMVAIRVSPYK